MPKKKLLQKKKVESASRQFPAPIKNEPPVESVELEKSTLPAEFPKGIDTNPIRRSYSETSRQYIESFTKPTADFTKALAHEIVRNLTTIGQLTTRPFRRTQTETKGKKSEQLGDNPMFVDTSVLIDGRILPIVNSGFLTGTLIVPEIVMGEVQHIADSPDSLRRAKGRRGLEVVGKVKAQKINSLLKTKITSDDVPDIKEVDHKLIVLAKRYSAKLLTVDFNLAQRARTQGVKVLNVNDLAQALKMAIIPGEEISLKITHEGKERQQGVGYIADGTMVIVDEAKDKVGLEVAVVVTKIHQTPAGQLFFARLK